MTIQLWAELFFMLVATLYAAYLVALLDLWLIKRRARKQALKDTMWRKLKHKPYD